MNSNKKLVLKMLVIFIAGSLAHPAKCEPLQKEDPRAGDLVQKAYAQIRKQQFDEAVPNLCMAIKLERNSVVARRYLSFALIQQGQMAEALQQLDLLDQLHNGIALDLFMKGVASEKLAEPTRAADWFRAAVDKEPANDFFRMKAINAFILLSKYDDASALSTDGVKLTANANLKKYYADQQTRTQYLSACVAKNRQCQR